MRLKKEVDDLKEDRQEKSRNQKLPEWIREFPNDAAKVETKAGRVAVNTRQVKLATGEGWSVVFHWFLIGAITPRLPLSTSKRGNAGSTMH